MSDSLVGGFAVGHVEAVGRQGDACSVRTKISALGTYRGWLGRSVAPLMLAVGLAGNLHAQSVASPYTTGHRYDAAMQETGTILPDPDGSDPLKYAAVRNTYNSSGYLVKTEKGELASWQDETVAPANWTGFTILQTVDFTIDVVGRRLTELLRGSISTGASLTQYSYDVMARLQCTAIRMNAAAYSSLPATACTLGSEGAQGPDRIKQNIYDAANRLIQVRKAVGTSLEQAEATYSYTPNGKQQDVVDANGNHSLMVYDGFDRLSQWQFPSKTAATAFDITGTPQHAIDTANAVNPNDKESYLYDANGNRTQLTKREGSVLTYGFDALNRMTSKGGSAIPDVAYTYDLLGRRLTAKFATGGLGITTAWDNAGRPTSNTDTTSGTSRMLSYQYDNDGNRKRVTHPDGNYFSYNYDGLDRILSIQENGGNTRIGFNYDTAGRRSALNRDNTFSTSYTYFDGTDRLKTLHHAFSGGYDQVLSFTYNPADQVYTRAASNDAFAWRAAVNTNRGYTVNGLNQYAAAGPYAQTYDANGNMTSDGTTTYGYDGENRLKTATGTHAATLTYDPLGRLASVAAGSTTTSFLYDGNELVAEYNGSTVLRRYVHGTSEDDPLMWYEGSGLGDLRFFHADEQGSITGISTEAGAVQTVNTYDEYGIPGSSNYGRFQYTGQAWIPELGIYHYKARAYSPALGRFMQTDPVGYTDNINLYAYVANDPVNHQDPTGNQTVPGTEYSGCNGDSACEGNVMQGMADNGPTLAGVASLFIPGLEEIGIGDAVGVERASASGLQAEAKQAVRSEARISPQKQAGHTPGTPQNANRIKQGTPTSTFLSKEQGEKVTQETHQTGDPVAGRPNVRQKDFGEPVGTGPNGGTQNSVRTHEDSSGQIHGHPCGPETPC